MNLIESLRERRKRREFCPTGFRTIDLGLMVFYIGRDPADPGKLLYGHYSCSSDIELLGFTGNRRWKSAASFKLQAAKALRKLCVEALEVLAEEQP